MRAAHTTLTSLLTTTRKVVHLVTGTTQGRAWLFLILGTLENVA
jgi:hypothetical protein